MRHGYSPGPSIRLDFCYWAAGRREAIELQQFLREETDYAVQTGSAGPFYARRWSVTGATQETEITLDILDQWVEWMVTAGRDHGCDFDGLGTSV